MAAPVVQPAFDGVVGPIIDAVDINGNAVKVVAPGFVQLGADGEPVTGGGAVTIADGADATQGAIADAPYVSGSGTLVSILKGIFGKLATGSAAFWLETTAALGASATFSGPQRDVGAATPGPVAYAYFNGYFLADQTGTARIECSDDGATWRTIATDAVAAATPLILQVPVTARYHRVVLANGATPQGTVVVRSSYTAA